MSDQFIKKYWPAENILFYLHFQNGMAVRQIEVCPNGKIFLSKETPVAGECTLYDQSIEELDLQTKDFITAVEFEQVWNKRTVVKESESNPKNEQT